MADYRFNKLASEKVAWVASNGARVEIEINLVQEETDYFFNGDWKPTRNGLNIRWTGTVDGKDESGFSIKSTGRSDFPHAFGRIGLIDEKYNLVLAAKAKVESHPAWIAKKDTEKKADQVDAEYARHTKAVDDMMTLGDKSY